MTNNIKGKVVIITGASSGIGEATAKGLAEKGAKVVLAARREERLKNLVKNIEQLGGEAKYKVTDVTSSEQVQSLANFAIKEYGQIDVLINNAGIMPGSFLHQNNVSEWDETIDINVKGVLYGIGAVLPHMRERSSGHIVNISSVAGHENPYPSGVVYYLTKHAVRLISEGLRAEEAMFDSNVRVTNISPGAIDTDLKYTVKDPEVREQVVKMYEQKTLSSEDMAKGIIYAINQDEQIAINEMIVRPINS
ncbi:SDR family oxidoreductase [Niallia circulans]|uniref:SDR family oxidoreductase n=1 Tax=Niallia circulans TaxID=1397 RepID=A0A553SRI4_NIACI|nr:SDR family oxidoreductase [Niallia circulans]TRZ39578.1 SDR family oxidoreductase [Niallia circulans]